MKKLILIAAGVLSFLNAPVFAEELAHSLPRLKVEGNHFTADGEQIALRGVSLCSLEWHDSPKQIADVTSSPDKWNVNILRLPVQLKEWDRVGAQAYLKSYLDPAVKLCKEKNVYCIIDWHAIDDWNKPESIKKLEDFWKLVGPRYASDKNILYEIFNEPTGPSERTKENWLAWRKQAQTWVDAIRVHAPHTVLLIGNPHWDQMPSFAVDDPFEGDNLAYVMHLYPNWKQRDWDGLFGDASKTIPIFITEWGWSAQDKAFWVIKGDKESYGEPLKAYLNARPQISWTAWSYDSLCGPAMLGPDKDMGDFVKQWLEESKR